MCSNRLLVGVYVGLALSGPKRLSTEYLVDVGFLTKRYGLFFTKKWRIQGKLLHLVNNVNSSIKLTYKLGSTLVSMYRNCLKIVDTIRPFEKCNLSA